LPGQTEKNHHRQPLDQDKNPELPERDAGVLLIQTVSVSLLSSGNFDDE